MVAVTGAGGVTGGGAGLTAGGADSNRGREGHGKLVAVGVSKRSARKAEWGMADGADKSASK